MHSTLKTLTIAAFALSFAAGGVLAADRSNDHGRDHNFDHFPNAVTHDHDPVPPIMSVDTAQAMVYKPRLDNVLAGLNSAERTIKRDEAVHKLSASSAQRLEGEANGIRDRAMTVADAHNGALPGAVYRHLEADIHKLDRDIVRMS